MNRQLCCVNDRRERASGWRVLRCRYALAFAVLACAGVVGCESSNERPLDAAEIATDGDLMECATALTTSVGDAGSPLNPAYT